MIGPILPSKRHISRKGEDIFKSLEEGSYALTLGLPVIFLLRMVPGRVPSTLFGTTINEDVRSTLAGTLRPIVGGL